MPAIASPADDYPRNILSIRTKIHPSPRWRLTGLTGKGEEARLRAENLARLAADRRAARGNLPA